MTTTAAPTDSQSTPGAVAAANAPTLSVAQRCHTDALHCIFAFLSLVELLPALQSCRSWLAAGCKEPSRSLLLRAGSDAVARLATSPLRHHIAQLILDCAPVQLDQLRPLHGLPRLTALDAPLDGSALRAPSSLDQSAGDSSERLAQLLRDAFPPHLRDLTLRLERGEPIDQSLIDALPALPALSALHFGEGMIDELDLSPLVQLPQLRFLQFWESPHPSQCADIKRMAALTALNFFAYSWTRDALVALLQPPHSLQRLQDLAARYAIVVDPPLLEGLLRLPALTTLQSGTLRPECWAGVSDLTQLRTLCVNFSGKFTAAQLLALQSSLRALPHLSDLAVNLQSDHQSDAPPLELRLPALRQLTLGGVRLPSLSFLQHSPLLSALLVSNCAQMCADDTLRWLRTLAPPLRFLGFHRSVRLSADQESLLHPPFALLPALVNFSYSPPQ